MTVDREYVNKRIDQFEKDISDLWERYGGKEFKLSADTREDLIYATLYRKVAIDIVLRVWRQRLIDHLDDIADELVPKKALN